MTDNELKYWAFLCYSHQDNREQRPDTQGVCRLCWADWLHDVLKTFSIPAEFVGQVNGRGELIPERIHPIFQDEQELPEDANLSADTRKALEQSRCLIVICSPRSAKNLQVNEAVRYFKQLGRGNHILPIVVAGEPNASESSPPGISNEDECFVPAMRHPVRPDGTLDTTRRAGRYLFADARHGDDKREILATDRREAETTLEIAKIQLIAGLIGVGFNGLWWREQKRRFVGFAEAQHQVREAQSQVQEARLQAQAAQSKVLEALDQARETQNQLEEARAQARQAQNKALEIQNLPRDVHSQIMEAQTRAEEAQTQAREAQKQLQEFQNKARDTQSQLEEVRNRALAAESKFLEAQNQAGEARRQAEETQRRLQEASSQVQGVPAEIQEARRQAEEAQRQIRELQSQAQKAQAQVQEARSQAEEAQNQVRDARRQAEEARGLLQEAQRQTREAQNQVLEIQNLPRDVQSQIQEAQVAAMKAQNQTREAQKQIQEFQQKARDAQSQVELAQNQAREAQARFSEAEKQVRAAQSRVLELENKARDAQSQLEDARSQIRAAESKVLEGQNQAREAQHRVEEFRNQARAAQNQVQEFQGKTQTARRLTKIFALMAVLALLAGSIAWWQRKVASEALAKVTTQEVRHSDSTLGRMDQEQIRQALQKMDGAGQDQLRKLNELMAQIPTEEIPATLKSSSALLDDRQRTYFQKQLLTRLAVVNPQSAMTNASAIEGKVVSEAGASNSSFYLQLAVLENWMKTDLPGAVNWVRQLPAADSRQRALKEIIPALAAENPTNTLALLNDLKPAPGEQIYALLFQQWATTDPVQAIEQRQQLPDQDAEARILSVIITVWGDQHPATALNWLQSQSGSESLPAGTWRSKVIADLFNDWTAKDLEAATAACQQLPDGMAKEKAWECVLSGRIAKDPASAAEDVKNLSPGDYRQKAIEELCHRWADTDAPAALIWAQSLPTEAEQVAALNQVVVHWVRKDPQAAMQFANQHPELSGDALGGIAETWAQGDLPAAMSWVESLPEGQKKDAALLALASSRAERAPKLAAKCCILLTTDQPRKEVVQRIARSLAKEDISGAVEWARSLKDDSTRQAALSALSEVWAQADPKGMATYALGLPASDAQTQYLTLACRQLAIRDLPGTLELLKPLSDGGLRQSMLEQAGRDCDLPHVDQAAKYIAAMPAGDDQKAAIKGLLSSWTPADPETAVNWLSSFPENNSQPEQVQSVIKAWSQTEPAAVAKWLANLPAGTASEEMVSAFLEGTVAKYPEYAAQWTKSVADEIKRQKYQVQVARQWMKTDRSAALKWINSLDLPEEIRQPLIAPSP